MRRRNKDFRNLVGGRVESSNELGEDTQSWKKSALLGECLQWKYSQPWCGQGSLGMENTAQERVRKRAWQNQKNYEPWKGITEKPRLQCIELGKEDKL